MAVNQSSEELKQLGLLKSMVRVTGEIASGRMQKARDGVLYRRTYLDELTQVFHQVHRSYMATRGKADKESGVDRFTTISHNGKKVAVFLSANTRLYGDLLQRTFDKFFEDVTTNGSEATIVGRVGKEMLRAKNQKIPVTIFEMKDEKLDEATTVKLVKHLVPYQEIHVFYGKYVNPVRQEAEEYTISSEMPELVKDEETGVIVDYLYEPSLKEVLKFFEAQIFKTMFEQTVVESKLAKYAARFVAMDRAEQQIDKKMEQTQKMMRLVKHRENNKKQLNLMGPVVARFNR